MYSFPSFYTNVFANKASYELRQGYHIHTPTKQKLYIMDIYYLQT